MDQTSNGAEQTLSLSVLHKNTDLVGCAHTPIAAAHRQRSLRAIDPSSQATQPKSSIWSEPSGLKATSPIGLVGQPFGLTVPVESRHRRIALPNAKLPQSLRTKALSQFLRSCFLTSKTSLTANILLRMQHRSWGLGPMVPQDRSPKRGRSGVRAQPAKFQIIEHAEPPPPYFKCLENLNP